MRYKIKALHLLVLILGIAVFQSCKTHNHRSNYEDANSLLHETKNLKTVPFLKAHLKNGDVCILKNEWTIDTLNDVLEGYGSRYNYKREMIYQGEMSFPIDSVAIFETNKKLKHPEASRIIALSILAGADIALGIYCLSVPKACFGSCPTFYINENDNFHYADAEGFSNAIAPSMEYYDIDALDNKPVCGKFSLHMKNEALETHCVNEVKLLAYPRKNGERVYQSPGNNFYLCEGSISPKKAMAAEGDITALVGMADRKERFSLADEKNLKSREEIFLEFEGVKEGNAGLLVNFRQSLMTTYFIYSAMGYMGDKAGDLFAVLESNKEVKTKLKEGIKKELGNIDVYVWNESSGNWELRGGLYETGPIAINRQILEIGNVPSGKVKVKIVLNKGLWRMDYLALTHIKKEVKPVVIMPEQILNKGKNDLSAMQSLQDSSKYIISMPGDEFKMDFVLPSAEADYELFLYSKGYYLEWMRAYWIKDKDLLKLRQMLEKPRKYLKQETRNFKNYEANMEQEFWNSKIDTKNFSYHED